MNDNATRDQERHDELRTRALENYLELSAGTYAQAINCLRDYEKKEYNRLEHKIYGQCEFCEDYSDTADPKECEFSCVCGEKDDPECAYCLSHKPCPALKPAN